MLQKDLQLCVLLGKRHLNYFTQLHDLKNDEILASQIRIFEKKLIVQYAPIDLLQKTAEELSNATFTVEKSVTMRHNPAGSVNHFNDYELRDLTRQNGAKLRRIVRSEFFQNSDILDCISPKLYGALCVEVVKDIQLAEFLDCCKTSSYDLLKTKFHILAKGFHELDETLILSMFSTIAVKTGMNYSKLKRVFWRTLIMKMVEAIFWKFLPK